MKNYKQILEAVNRGIKFALDDFDDNEQIQGQSNSKVNHGMNTKEYLELMSQVVDLGLPSETLWCKYNLDVNPKQLSKALDWYGNYYAWGEIEPKANTDYIQKKYKWWDIVEVEETYGQATRKPWTRIEEKPKLKKYCVNVPDYFKNNHECLYDKIDNLNKLLPEDDAAYCNNNNFCMPTKEQCNELLTYTIQKFVENYQNIKNLNGVVLTSKINKKRLFIPAAGIYIGDNDLSKRKDAKVLSCFWTSTLDVCHLADAKTCDMFNSKNAFRPGLETMIGTTGRECGLPIRPVLNL